MKRRILLCMGLLCADLFLLYATATRTEPLYIALSVPDQVLQQGERAVRSMQNASESAITPLPLSEANEAISPAPIEASVPPTSRLQHNTLPPPITAAPLDTPALSKYSPTPEPTLSPTRTPKKSATKTYKSVRGDSRVERIVELVNRVRADVGVEPLQGSTLLNEAAQLRAEESVELFSHTRPNGGRPNTAIEGLRYAWWGENLAYGQRTPEEVVKAWVDSPGHYANLVRPEFTHIGIGIVDADGRIYWSQLFIQKAE